MDAHVVVGVGNIYASESLHLAGHPSGRPARRGSRRARYERLAGAVRTVLGRAIAEGGTTLRDFVREDGEPGYFSQHLLVYGPTGEVLPALRRADPPARHRPALLTTFFLPATRSSAARR